MWKILSILVLAMVAGQEIEDSGMKLAMLTCVTRLLEAKCEELEGEGGTGRLERDQQLLEAAHQSEGLPSSQHMLTLWQSVLQWLFSGRPSLFLMPKPEGPEQAPLKISIGLCRRRVTCQAAKCHLVSHGAEEAG